MVVVANRGEFAGEHCGVAGLVEGELLELQQVRRTIAVRLPVRLDGLAEDSDAVGRVMSVLDNDCGVTFHRERGDGREVLANLGRLVRAPVFVLRRWFRKIRQRDVEIVLAVIAEGVELGHPRGQLEHGSKQILLLARVTPVVDGEGRNRLVDLKRVHIVS